MSSAKSQQAKNGAGRYHESVSHAPLPESPSQAPALTSTSQNEAVSTEHLGWASLIKEQHRHLQAAVQSGVSGSGTVVTAMGASYCLTASAPPPSYHEELKAWRCTLTGEAAAQRLSAYAEAMHHLATLYWNPSVTPLAGHGTGVDDSSRARGEPAAHGGRAATSESTAPRLGEKRKRSSDTADGVQTPSSFVMIGEAMSATVTATMSDTDSRHYSDRLGYCLQSIASYYLGEAETEGCGEGTAGSAPGAADGRPPAAVQSSSLPCFRVCVEQTRFRQLPGVFARVVKPLRRLFFQRYGRMATEAEVGHLIRACTPSRDGSCSIAPKMSRAGGFSCLSSSTDSISGSTTEVCAVRGLIDEDVDARAIVEESTWRRGEHTAWATALHYTRGAPHATPTSAPAPLWTLDVGSCYGPFFGRILSRTAPLAPVPLHVTSMDLAPYQGAAGCNNGSNGAPSPCVWQADWLQMGFFAEEPEADEAVRGSSTAVASGTAEEGRVRYQRQRPASSLTDGGGNSGLHPCDSRDGSAGDAAQSSLAATAVRLESYDAVFFCLLLSYIPTPRLRFLACIHAFLALKEGGLLVIVSTRTQGPRRRNWMSEWTTCLASIGFQRVQQSIQEKLVGMSFAKVSPSAEVRRSWATAEGRAAWIESLMASSAALEGLRITADDARSRADI
ncbi:hypothetical protein, conserved [Leishmania donovani]|uniref:Probable methyltransferase BMT2 homolog n=1 Tax=Leishmania donovani TaxID=5661 RepID=E9BGE4_LEIDO|nr:hypothetical protein, conserved [Leishmania donovani]CBZ34320.1 hypothetical protein, conserved [Leishmania donovani]